MRMNLSLPREQRENSVFSFEYKRENTVKLSLLFQNYRVILLVFILSTYVSQRKSNDVFETTWKSVRIPVWILSAFVLGDRIPLTHFLWKKIFIQNMQPWRSYARVAIHLKQEVLSREMRYVSKHVLSAIPFILVRKLSWRRAPWINSMRVRRRLSHSMRVKINSIMSPL